MQKPLLGGLIGGLLGPAMKSQHENPMYNQGPLNKMQDIITSLDRCDVKEHGMCCYFPDFCDSIARCVSTPSPANVFEIAQTIPKCVCPEGFEGDGRSKGTGCVNINECLSGSHKCQHECVDLIPGYTCRCHKGFRLNPDARSCTDVDECSENSHSCSHICLNEVGGYSCACRPGYKIDPEDSSQCIDIDECEEARLTGFSVCQFDELCLNLKGTYQCECPSGMRPSIADTRRCEDIDECIHLDDPCPRGVQRQADNDIMFSNQFCENVYGGFVCDCLSGTRGQNNVLQEQLSELRKPLSRREQLLLSAKDLGDRHKRSMDLAMNQECVDIDECEEDESLCKTAAESVSAARCVNEIRSYRCQCQLDGLVYDTSSQTCVDIDECKTNVCGEDPNILCINESPGYHCQCQPGYTKIETTSKTWLCVDEDECDETSHTSPCPMDAQCINLEGTYKCICAGGFQWHPAGLGQCIDIDECALGYCRGPCQNTHGSFVCACPTLTSSEALDVSQPGIVKGASRSGALHSVFSDIAPRATEGECEELSTCKELNGEWCGSGFVCSDIKPGQMKCTCSARESLVELRTQPQVLLALSERIGRHLQSTPSEVLREFHPLHLLQAFLTLEPHPPMWKIRDLNWQQARRYVFGSDIMTAALTSASSEPGRALAELYSDFLYNASMQTCISMDACESGGIICTGIRPCCRPLGNDRAECLPLRYKLTGRASVCPLGARLQDAVYSD